MDWIPILTAFGAGGVVGGITNHLLEKIRLRRENSSKLEELQRNLDKLILESQPPLNMSDVKDAVSAVVALAKKAGVSYFEYSFYKHITEGYAEFINLGPVDAEDAKRGLKAYNLAKASLDIDMRQPISHKVTDILTYFSNKRTTNEFHEALERARNQPSNTP